ncbi:ABC transporter substrate-binding protein [Egicoccus sp. AB-alg2]|uniref:ABC transporter substrate-binding protein n=1 Tax=Egicoccus sp. AB-alg2 TaxID=3242693 RepID=UPI00359E0878
MNEPSTISRRTFLRRAGGTALLLPMSSGALGTVLSACSGGAPQETAELSTAYMTALGLGTNFLEVMVAAERGFFADEGLEVDIMGGQGSGPAIQSVLARSAELARTDPINSIPAVINEGAELTNIATVQQVSPFEIASLPEAPITDPADLDGKTIGIVSAGGGTDTLLDLLLISAGLTPDTVSRPVVGVGFAPYELARNGEIDGWVAQSTARALIEREESVQLPVILPNDHVSLPSSSYILSRQQTDVDSEVPVRFLAGVLRAMEWMLDESNHEQAVADLRVYNPDIDPEQAAFELPLLVESWTAGRGADALLELDTDEWDQAQAGLQGAGLVETTVDLDQLLDTRYLDQVKGR